MVLVPRKWLISRENLCFFIPHCFPCRVYGGVEVMGGKHYVDGTVLYGIEKRCLGKFRNVPALLLTCAAPYGCLRYEL